MAAAEAPREAVSIRGLVGPRHGGLAVEESAPQLTEVRRAFVLFFWRYAFVCFRPPSRHSAPGQGKYRLVRLEPARFGENVTSYGFYREAVLACPGWGAACMC